MQKQQSLWDMIEAANAVLKHDFLCVPPYQCVNGVYIGELSKMISEGKKPRIKVCGTINLPSQRAYQMEYRYKKCSIFQPFMPAIEYATYCAMEGNWICSYLTFLPVVEAVLRKWGEVEPSLTFNKMKGFAPALIDYLKDREFFPDDRIRWTNSHIEYLRYILCEVLYVDFDAYSDKSFSEIFNRNLSLHKLEGVMDISEGLANVTRIMLVLDIIAELYFMQTPQEYWQCTFYADPEKDLDFMLRWKLYIKLAQRAVGPNDLLVVYNAFLGNATEESKRAELRLIELGLTLKEKVREATKQKGDHDGTV